MRRVRVECGALRLEGDVLIDMPANHSRVLDLLNRPGDFLNVREGDATTSSASRGSCG